MKPRIVETRYGKIEGLPAGNPAYTVFKGIPYVLVPIEENRWRSPKPPKEFEDCYQAFKFKDVYPQIFSERGVYAKENPQELVLNLELDSTSYST